MHSHCQLIVKQSEQLILCLMHKAKVKEVWSSCFGVVHILRNQPRGGGGGFPNAYG